MEKHRIGILSDTHGLLRPEVTEILKSCELILHAGDIGGREILDQLEAIAPVKAVRGNTDRDPGARKQGQTPPAGEMPWELPEEREMELFGFRFYMVHNKKHIRREPAGTDGVICGHSHKYEAFSEGGIWYLNPGSCGPGRFRLPVTMMVLTLEPETHRMEAERIAFAETPREGEKKGTELSEQDLCRLVKNVMKGVKAGKSVAELATRNRAEEKLVEDICRMYVTHPGVDAEGIMDRLERRGL